MNTHASHRLLRTATRTRAAPEMTTTSAGKRGFISVLRTAAESSKAELLTFTSAMKDRTHPVAGGNRGEGRKKLVYIISFQPIYACWHRLLLLLRCRLLSRDFVLSLQKNNFYCGWLRSFSSRLAPPLVHELLDIALGIVLNYQRFVSLPR